MSLERIIATLQDHAAGSALLWLALAIMGVWLLWDRRGRQRRHGNSLRTGSRDLVIGANSYGSSEPGTGCENSRVDWLDIASLIVAVISAVIVALVWLFPRAPT